MTRIHVRCYLQFACSFLFSLFALATLAAPAAKGQAIEGFPLLERNFSHSAPRGFGDRHNSWPQAMIWWQDNLYVGTSRDSVCSSLYSIHEYLVVPTFGRALADQFMPYPPLDPDLSCAADGADLSLQSEIWRWSPRTNGWQRVYQSPATLDNPGPGPPAPPRTGKKLPYEVSFRGFTVYKDSTGTESLYAFGINSTALWDRNQLPPPRILRTTDGLNWNPLPQTPGTFLHDLPFNPDHSSFRSPVTYDGRIFVLSGPIFGQGQIIASANPAQGNNAWFLASPPGMFFYELEVFNGWLYVGGYDPDHGYAVFKTKAQGSPPYALTTVVPPGGYLTNLPSKSVVSMHVHQGRLYVGTGTQTEIIRINPDDTWDLVAGTPRQVPSTGEWKYPISGLDAGFGQTLNDHAWYMTDPYKHLYIGTYNAATGSRLDPVFGPQLKDSLGAQLYRTPDNWYFSPVTMNGFAALSGPLGGKFDYGIRTMASTPYGVFVGTANDYYGLAIFHATKRTSPEVGPPVRLELEQRRSGGAILSWQSAMRAVSYRIFRAEIVKIGIRDNLNTYGYGGWGQWFEKIPDTYISKFLPIGTATDFVFVDTTTQPGKRYMYYVAGVGASGALSEPSSLVTFPLLYPSVTFSQLMQEVNRWGQRNRFLAPNTAAAVQQTIVEARNLAATCKLGMAVNKLNPQQLSRTLQMPEVIDFEVLLSKMVRRLQVYSRFPLQVPANEFCTTPAP